jgi:hypothetical protein
VGLNFDLFGLPVKERRGDAGRPSHEPTDEIRNKIIVLFALGWTKESVASAIGLSLPTFRKHYFSEIKMQDVALLRVKGRQIERLWTKAEGGDVGAMKEIGKMLDRVELAALSERVSTRKEEEAPRAPKLGKKEQQKVAARAITGKFSPPSGPSRRVN